MELEDVLRQNAELEDFLRNLVQTHAIALQDQGLSDRLDVIRRDILICFNDLETLNEMLISCDGRIREEVGMLQKCKSKIGKLANKRQQLLEKRDQWNQKTNFEMGARTPIPLIVDASYRSGLDEYLKLASDRDAEGAARESSPGKTWQSLELLNSCRDSVCQSIRQATELLHDFQKDQDFIEKEIRSQSARVRRKVSAIDDEIHKNDVSRRELMSKVGLPLPASRESSTAQRLLHLNLNNDRDKELQSEEEDILNHAEEFVDMKIASLQDQLTHKRENSSSLADARDLWNDCIGSVKRLEDRITSLLSNKSLSNSASSKLKSWIEQSLQELTEIIESTDNEILIKLVTDEREVIEKALHEMSQPVGATESVPTTKKDRSNPTFLVAGKSPPKIGVSEKTAQRLNDVNSVTSPSSLAFLKDKSTKKE